MVHTVPSTLGRLRKKDLKSEARLCYIVRFCLKRNLTKLNEKGKKVSQQPFPQTFLIVWGVTLKTGFSSSWRSSCPWSSWRNLQLFQSIESALIWGMTSLNAIPGIWWLLSPMVTEAQVARDKYHSLLCHASFILLLRQERSRSHFLGKRHNHRDCLKIS